VTRTSHDTEPGLLLGTVTYMSPEQVRGQAADARSDLFALGAILYEMVTGRRAFARDTPADTMTAILSEDPPELTRLAVAPGLDRIVRHCLEKLPDERFQSARDLAFDLEALSDASGAAVRPAAPRARRQRPAQRLVLSRRRKQRRPLETHPDDPGRRHPRRRPDPIPIRHLPSGLGHLRKHPIKKGPVAADISRR